MINNIEKHGAGLSFDDKIVKKSRIDGETELAPQ